MKKLISERLAVNSILFILSVIVLFHIAILTGLIPFDIVWGGRLKDAAQMRRFETVSILTNAVMIAVVSIRGGYLPVRIPARIITIALWLMGALFVLNTLGNLASVNAWERLIFTPLTAVLALLCFRLAIYKRDRLYQTAP
jgi:hypothetical protein